MRGSNSYEFTAEADAASDTRMKCENCKFSTNELKTERCGESISEPKEVNGIKIEHYSRLSTRYSDSMDLTFNTEDREDKKVIMGCYGTGISCLIKTTAYQNNDEKGITGNREVDALNTAVILASEEKEAREKAEQLYQELSEDEGVLPKVERCN